MERSKSTLQLIEIIICITIFAICAAVCVKIITVSYLMTQEAVDTRNALSIAETKIENFKVVRGDVPSQTSFFDDNWIITTQDNARFVMEFVQTPDDLVIFGDVSVSVIGGDELLNLRGAARRSLNE